MKASTLPDPGGPCAELEEGRQADSGTGWGLQLSKWLFPHHSLHLYVSIFPLSFHLFSYSAFCHSHSYFSFLTFSLFLLFWSFIYIILFFSAFSSFHNISKFVLEIQYMSENIQPKETEWSVQAVTGQNRTSTVTLTLHDISHVKCFPILYLFWTS